MRIDSRYVPILLGVITFLLGNLYLFSTPWLYFNVSWKMGSYYLALQYELGLTTCYTSLCTDYNRGSIFDFSYALYPTIPTQNSQEQMQQVLLPFQNISYYVILLLYTSISVSFYMIGLFSVSAVMDYTLDYKLHRKMLGLLIIFNLIIFLVYWEFTSRLLNGGSYEAGFYTEFYLVWIASICWLMSYAVEEPSILPGASFKFFLHFVCTSIS